MKAGTIQIEDAEYSWSIIRKASFNSAEGFTGMAILVKRTGANHRTLLLEFTMDGGSHRCEPQRHRFRFSDRRLTECIQNAIQAGWDPNARGKRFRFEAGPVNPNYL